MNSLRPAYSEASNASVAVSPVVMMAGVKMAYNDGADVFARLDLTVSQGEFLTLIGPSGCGKSTLLKLIARVVKPTAGTIHWWGADAMGLNGHHKKLAFVFQDPTLMPWATVAANVQLPLDLAGISTAGAQKRVKEALVHVGLSECATHYPRQLSGGMKMRVSIARALVTEPDLLLMDEPFGALDEFTRNRLDTDLYRLCRERCITTVFVTHSIYEAAFLSSRVAVMAAKPGRILEIHDLEASSVRDASYRLQASFSDTCRVLSRALVDASLAGAKQ
jgi:NitT/TauT family transport system ATP-binding protein